MSNLWLNIRYALRQLRKSPGFTLTAVVTLALGVGANTAIFTLVQSVLLRSLPVANPSQLYRIGDEDQCCIDGGFPQDAPTSGDFSIFSYDLFEHLKQSAPEFQQLAAVQAGQWPWTVRRGDELAKSLQGEFVSGNYFAMLGLKPFEGRLFSGADDTESAAPAMVLSYEAWQGEYAGDPSIVGSTIYVQARPFTVIGIAPPGFFGDRVTDTPPDFWMPIQMEPYVEAGDSVLHEPEMHWLYALGRVRPGTSIAALQAKLTVALRQWIWSQPQMVANGGAAIIARQHVAITPGGGGIQNLQEETGEGLKLLMILSTVVLLIACANIANLLLARSTARRVDLAVRMAIGAGRRAILRQIVVESVVLSLIGGLAGLGVAYGGSRLLLALAFPGARNLPISASPSPAVLGFAFLVALVTGILFAAAPAWLSFHAHPVEALRGVNRATRDRSSLPQKALVVFQAALSMVLLAGAILMTRSLANLEHQNFGVATAHRYVFHFDAQGAGYTIGRLPALYRQLEDHFAAMPGMKSMSLALYSPLEGDNWSECVIQQGHAAPHADQPCTATWDRVSTHFLDSIGVPIVRGRGFTEQDTATSLQVALVNQAFVRKFFPNQDPIGQHFGIDLPQYSSSFEIVGVFRDFKINDPRDPVHPVYLRSLKQQFTGYTNASMIRTETRSMFVNAIILDFNVPPPNVEDLVRRTMANIDPNLTVTDLRSFGTQVAANFTHERLVARLTSLFGLLALVLASVGLYGVMSYFVARRTGEIGIRMALGARRNTVVAMVMGTALAQIAFGLALGIPAALATGHLMASQLYGIGSYDPLAFAGATLALAVCASLAGLIPARRAASIEPMKALRSE
jgi:predicted permease